MDRRRREQMVGRARGRFPRSKYGLHFGHTAAPRPNELQAAGEHPRVGSEALNDRRWERQRRQLIETIREQGIDDLEVLRAFDLVQRHLFMPESVQHRAYEDNAVPIGFGQTISQPSIQALYLQSLAIQPTDRVLEIG